MVQLAAGELRGRADKLVALSAEAGPDNVLTVLRSGTSVFADIPGDADGLEDLSVACGRAAEHLETVATESLPSVTVQVEETWSGTAAETAAVRVSGESSGTAADARPFAVAAKLLEGLADGIVGAREQHSRIHEALAELTRVTAELHANGDDDKEAAAALARQASAALGAAAQVYQALLRQNEKAASELVSLSYGDGKFTANTPDGRRSLEEILERYQIRDSRSEMVDFPPPELVDVVNPILQRLGKDVPSSKWTVEELELFSRLNPAQMYEWYQIQQDSYVVSEQNYSGIDHTTHSHVDAFRHTYWNARMTQEFGEEWAEGFATSHEQRPGNDRQSEAMDLHNNELGRRIAVENPGASPEELSRLVGEAVSDGEAIVITEDSRIAYSDQVEHNATVDPEQHDESHVDHDGFIEPDFGDTRPKRFWE